MSFEFELGTPFKPYQQLMGVLPEASKEQIPLAYRVCLILPASHSIVHNSCPTGPNVQSGFSDIGLLSQTF